MTLDQVLAFASEPANWDIVVMLAAFMFLLVCAIIASVIMLFQKTSTAHSYDPKQHFTCGQTRPPNQAHHDHEHSGH